jgi:hypothetical protein
MNVSLYALLHQFWFGPDVGNAKQAMALEGEEEVQFVDRCD